MKAINLLNAAVGRYPEANLNQVLCETLWVVHIFHLAITGGFTQIDAAFARLLEFCRNVRLRAECMDMDTVH